MTAAETDRKVLCDMVLDESAQLVDFSNFLEKNPLSRPAKFQAAFSTLQGELYEKVCTADAQLKKPQVVQDTILIVARAVRATLPCKWVLLASLVTSVELQSSGIPDDVREQLEVLFPSGRSDAELFLILRAQYILELLVSLSGGKWAGARRLLVPENTLKVVPGDALAAFSPDATKFLQFWVGLLDLVDGDRGEWSMEEPIESIVLKAEVKAGLSNPLGAPAAAPSAAAKPAAPAARAEAAPQAVEPNQGEAGSAKATDPARQEGAEELDLVSFKKLQVDLVEGSQPQGGITPSMAILKKLCSALESFVFQTCGPGTIGSDSGHALLYLNRQTGFKKDSGLYYKNEGNVMLQFCGRVTLVPVPGAIPLLTAFNLDFYITPTGSDDPLGEHCVPAWLVRSASEQEAESVGGRYCAPKMVPIKFTWQYTPVLGTPKKLDLTLNIWRIQYAPDGADEAPKELLRGPIETMLSKATVPKKKAKQTAVAVASAAAPKKKATDGQADAQWRGCKHLFA